MDNFYKIGGSLSANDPSYVVREADHILFNYLRQGEYCFILNSRQMGKSSLLLRTARKLTNEEIYYVNLDLTLIGDIVKPENWYYGLANLLIDRLKKQNIDLEINLKTWWSQYKDTTKPQDTKNLNIPELQIIYYLLELILLKIKTQKLVIFLDEIDTLMRFNFKDDFFAFIRACYNQRAENPNFERLCFCLLGVASPHDLISDPNKTPFNIGRSIELMGFTFDEAKTALLPGLVERFDQPDILLKEILNWTGGQPFLTQKVCNLVVEFAESQHPNAAEIVQTHIIQYWEDQDVPVHLRTIRDRLVSNEEKLITLLSLYQQILEKGYINFDNSPEQFQLRLTGLVTKKQNQLVLYNPIYQSIFTLEWSNIYLENQRPYNYALKAWLSSEKNPSFLLAGKELAEAENWSKSKTLSNVDYQFLAASQKQQDQSVNKVLEKANKKAKYTLTIASVFSLGLILATFLTANYQLNRARNVIKLEKESNIIEQQFSVSPIESLIQGIKAGQKLKTLVNSRQSLNKYPTLSPITALFNTLRRIQIKSEFKLQNYNNSWGIIAFSPDGTAIAASNLLNDKEEIIQVWHSITGQVISTKTLKPAQALSKKLDDRRLILLKFSPDNRLILGLTKDGTVSIWERSGNLISRFNILDKQAFDNNPLSYTIEFSPDSQSLAMPTSQGDLQIVSLQGKLLNQLQRETPKMLLTMRSISFSPNGQFIASGSADGKLRVWNNLDNSQRTFLVSKGGINQVKFNPKNNLIAIGDDLGNVFILNLEGKIQNYLQIGKFSITNLQFSPNGQHLAISDNKGLITVRPISLSSQEILRTEQADNYDLLFSPDGKTLKGASRNGQIRAWQILQFSLMPITNIAFKTDSKLLILSKSDGTIEFRKDNQILKIYKNKEEASEIKGIFWEPNKNIIITVQENGSINQWSENGFQIKNLFDFKGNIKDAAFSTIENKILLATDGEVISVDFTGKQQQTIIPKQHDVRLFAINSADQTIAFTDKDNRLYLWDQQKQKIPLMGNSMQIIQDISFNRNGSLLAVSDANGVLKIWDKKGNLLLTSKVTEKQQITSFDFSSDKNTLIFSDRAGRILTLKLTLDDLMQDSCAWLQDYFKANPEALNQNLICKN